MVTFILLNFRLPKSSPGGMDHWLWVEFPPPVLMCYSRMVLSLFAIDNHIDAEIEIDIDHFRICRAQFKLRPNVGSRVTSKFVSIFSMIGIDAGVVRIEHPYCLCTSLSPLPSRRSRWCLFPLCSIHYYTTVIAINWLLDWYHEATAFTERNILNTWILSIFVHFWPRIFTSVQCVCMIPHGKQLNCCQYFYHGWGRK